MTANQIIISALGSILRATRPAALPDTVQIATEGDTEPLVRPYIVFESGDSQELHPRLQRVGVTMTLHTRADEQTDDVAGGWIQAASDTLFANAGSLHSTVFPYGWRVKKFTGTTGDDGEEPDRARRYAFNFSVWAERI